jgi:D-alanine-D-alanine ligase
MKAKKIRVAVMMGGWSNESDISRRTGAMVLGGLSNKFQVIGIDPKTDLEKLTRLARKKRIDVVFNALHGSCGEDGKIQGLLELLNIPYTGSGVLASALAMDKAMTKRIYLAAGIPTAPALLVTKQAWKASRKKMLLAIKKQLGSHVVIKPNASGSSVGVTVNPAWKNLPTAIQKALKEDGSTCLVETYRKGRELTVGVLGTSELQALPVVEIRVKRPFFDYKAKYDDHSTEELVPAPIPEAVSKEAQAIAIAAHIALGCYSYSRTDMIWHERGLDILETNTLPGLTSASLLPKAAQAAGWNFPQLLDLLIQHALMRR